MRWDFQGAKVGNSMPRKAQNEAWGGVWATHGVGKGLGWFRKCQNKP